VQHEKDQAYLKVLQHKARLLKPLVKTRNSADHRWSKHETAPIGHMGRRERKRLRKRLFWV